MSNRSGQLKNRIAASAIKLIIGLLVSTYQIEWVAGKRKISNLSDQSRPLIVCLWHNRIVFLAHLIKQLAKQKFPVTIMISLSKDGDLAARLGEKMGAKVVRGSPTKGGTEGLRGLYRSVSKEKRSILILPDGSKGPIYEAKMGLVVLSRMTQAPVLPVSCFASDYWRVRSWDRMIVPKPFSKVVINVGDEISIGRNAQDEALESCRQSVENSLNLLGLRVEKHFIDENAEKRHAI